MARLRSSTESPVARSRSTTRAKSPPYSSIFSLMRPSFFRGPLLYSTARLLDDGFERLEESVALEIGDQKG